ncbi:hypothetical protein cand_007090 [Cryptosporidium andersoni]|uniref:START domain-containing protein n=1 Tax=Cryptosporidium andersoni TaxID=117008 RepID=A0A1J4MPL5_9CRYT|nr:hypothetical protein cand_007090 [Cryptosporidium andersoni]
MVFSKFFPGFWVHQRKRLPEDNVESLEESESHFLLILRRTEKGKIIANCVKQCSQFSVFDFSNSEYKDNLIKLVVNLNLSNDKIISQVEELKPSDKSRFWGDWPPPFSWLFLLGIALYDEISVIPEWEFHVDSIIPLHNGESLFELLQESKNFLYGGITLKSIPEYQESSDSRLSRQVDFLAPALFNIMCNWCDYFGPTTLTWLWVIFSSLFVSFVSLGINIFLKLIQYQLNLGQSVESTATSYILISTPLICSFGLIFLTSLADQFPLPNFNEEKLIQFIILKSKAPVRTSKVYQSEYRISGITELIHSIVAKAYISNYIPNFYSLFLVSMAILSIATILCLSLEYYSTLFWLLQTNYGAFFFTMLMSHFLFRIFCEMEINLNFGNMGNFVIFALPVQIKNLGVFLFYILFKKLFKDNSKYYLPLTMCLIILIHFVAQVMNFLPFSAQYIAFKLGPSQEINRASLGDQLRYYSIQSGCKDTRISSKYPKESNKCSELLINSGSGNGYTKESEQFPQEFDIYSAEDNTYYKETYSTLYQDMECFSLLQLMACSICTQFPVTASFILTISSILLIIIFCGKLLMQSTRPWLLQFTLSHRIWQLILETNMMLVILFVSAWDISKGLKTYVITLTISIRIISNVNYSCDILRFISETIVLSLFRLIPSIYTQTSQISDKSLSSIIDKVIERRHILPPLGLTSPIPKIQPLINSGDISLIQSRKSALNISPLPSLTTPPLSMLLKFRGYWCLLRNHSDSLQELNAALGVSWIIRRAVDKLNPVVHYDVDISKGLIVISTTLGMGINNKITLVIEKENNSAIKDDQALISPQISGCLPIGQDEDLYLNKQSISKRRRSSNKYIVIEQPNTTCQWSEDMNVILETRQHKDGFKMVEMRRIISSSKLPFQIKGNDGKIIDGQDQDILCYKVILKGCKSSSNSKNILLVCSRYFKRKEDPIKEKQGEKLSNGKFSAPPSEKSSLVYSDEQVFNQSATSQDLSLKDDLNSPWFLGSNTDFPKSVQHLADNEDQFLSIVEKKKGELLSRTEELLVQVDEGFSEWSLERSSNGFKIYKKDFQNAPFMSCGITTIKLQNRNDCHIDSNNIKINKFIFTCVKDIVDYIWDSSTKVYYDPMVEYCKPLYYFKSNPNICIVYQAFKGQWGVAGRDFVVICYRVKRNFRGNNHSTNSSCPIEDSNCSNSMREEEILLTQSVEWSNINDSYVRAQNYFATYVFRPGSKDNEIQLIYLNQVDLQTVGISAWIIKKVILDQMNSVAMLRDIIQKS